MWGAAEVSAAYAQAFLIGVLLDQGDIEGARAFLDGIRLERIAPRATAPRHVAALLYAEGRHAESLDALDVVVDVSVLVRNPVWRPWRSLRALPLHGLGRDAEAVALLDEELALAQVWGATSTIGRTLRMVAELRDDPETATAELAQSIDLLSSTGSQAPAGPRTSRDGPHPARPRAGGPPSRTGAGTGPGVRCPWPARRHRRPTGGARRNSAEPARDHHADKRGTQDGRDGQAVRAIAQVLFVTPRTVEVTLAELRERLGLTSDVELAGALDLH